MNGELDMLLQRLVPEIDRKCEEIRKVRAERLMRALFPLLCGVVVLTPTSLIFFGIGLRLLFIPVLFCTVAFLALSPILIRQQGGSYEQV
jgi:hypothetical protein